ncbi:Solute carrier organic anion transporter family member 1C1 [Bagarius yarrelli]|uniref:Solute carrier organic anion transporter family member 1C1 n=1 Tax=Bagarius yarrelli TaxID=175774 RepID=A0A556TH36_BAGYA|nr:Solute carrier organic anion transporter family member 1C1 [Bagarius yarrelli]
MQTFNATMFHVKSTCPIILTHFSHAGVECYITVQRDASGVMKKVQILVNKIATTVQDGILTVEGNSISLPYDHTYQSVYNFGIYTRLTSKVLPLSVTWYSLAEGVTSLWVQLDRPLVDGMTGMCGRINGSETRAQLLDSNVIHEELCVTSDSQLVEDKGLNWTVSIRFSDMTIEEIYLDVYQERYIFSLNSVQLRDKKIAATDLSQTGLCGSNNNNTEDDFTTSSGIVENSARLFASSWAIGDCASSVLDVCVNNDNEIFAEEKCSQLTNTTGVFAPCHDYVPVHTYLSACIQKTCQATSRLQQHVCVGLGNYAKACASQGIIIGDWRAETGCTYTCDGNLRFDYAMQACNRTCRSLSGPDPTCDMLDDPVEGCGCESGTHLNTQLKCSPRALCDCTYPDCPPGQICVHCAQTPVSTLQRTCPSLSKPTSFDESCTSGCYCPEGQFADHNGSCVTQERCTCEFSGMIYASGESVESNCKTCTCRGGQWDCIGDPCPGVCEVFGNGQYKTFDSSWYRFDGHCQYTLVEDVSGLFSINAESVPCCDEALTCSRAISVKLKDEVTLILCDMNVTQKLHNGWHLGAQSLYSVHTVGLYIIVSVPQLGLNIIWDKQTKIKIELQAYWNGKVRGLCGDFDGKLMNDLLTSSSTVVFSTLEFGNSWKTAVPPCSDVTEELFPCERHSYCAAWAQRRCMILHSDTFKACHLKVDPTPYYQACVLESCSCDFEGKFLGFCTTVATYADACTTQNVCIKWRTPDLCPVYCDYYNEEGQYSWHYEACPRQFKTCGKKNKFLGNLEGCYPQCPTDMPYYDENRKKCTSLDRCTCYFNNTVLEPDPCFTTPGSTTTVHLDTSTTPITTKHTPTTSLTPTTLNIQTGKKPTTHTAGHQVSNYTSTTAGTTITKTTEEPTTVSTISTTPLTTTTTEIPKTTTKTSTLELTTEEPTSTTPLTTTTTTTETPITTTKTVTPGFTSEEPTSTTQETTTETPIITTKTTTSEFTTEEPTSTTPLTTTTTTTETPITTTKTVTPGFTSEEPTSTTQETTTETPIITTKTTTSEFTTEEPTSTTPLTTTTTTTETPITTTKTVTPGFTSEEPTSTTQETTTETPIITTKTTTSEFTTEEPTSTTPLTTTTTETPITTTKTVTPGFTSEEPTSTTQETTTETPITTTKTTTSEFTTEEPTSTTPLTTTTTTTETPITTTKTVTPGFTSEEPTSTTQETTTETPIITTKTTTSEFTTEEPTSTTPLTTTTVGTPITTTKTSTLEFTSEEPTSTTQETTTETPITTTKTSTLEFTTEEPTSTTPLTTTTIGTPVTTTKTSTSEFTTKEPTSTTPITTTKTVTPELTTEEPTSTTQATTTETPITTTKTVTPGFSTEEPTSTTPLTTTTIGTPKTTTKTSTSEFTTEEPTSTTPLTKTTTTIGTPKTTTKTSTSEFTTEEPTSTTPLTKTTTETPITTAKRATTTFTSKKPTSTIQATTTKTSIITTSTITTVTKQNKNIPEISDETSPSPTALETPVTTTTTPSTDCKDPNKNQTWPEGFEWTEDCYTKICKNGVIELRPLICQTPVIPVCPRGTQKLIKDKQGCCDTWQCDCQCDVFGDPHYMSFAGQNFVFLENCTYILVKETIPRHRLSISVDNYYCEPLASCARGIIVQYQNNTVKLQVVDVPNDMPILQITLNQVTIKPPYQAHGLRFESTDAEVYLYIDEIRSNIFLSVWNTLQINLAMEHFLHNTQGQCGVCGGPSCTRRNGIVETEDCCDKTAYEWIEDDPMKPYCQQARRHVPCHTNITTTTVPSATPTASCQAPLCELLRHQAFSKCSGEIDVEKLVSNCKFDYCVAQKNSSVCSPLERLADQCKKMGVCVAWRNLTNGICDVACPDGMIFDECRSTPTDFCQGGVRVPGTTLDTIRSGCFCPDNQLLADTYKKICVSLCTNCRGPLGEPMPVGAIWESNCHTCTCNNQTLTEECRPNPPLPTPTCSPGSALTFDCCKNQICVEKTCEYNGTTYKVGETWKDPRSPCLTYHCTGEGIEIERSVCPQPSGPGEHGVWDEHQCCDSCNTTCGVRLSKMTVENCTQEVMLPICEGNCASGFLWMRAGKDLQLEHNQFSCREKDYEFRQISLANMSVEKKQARQTCCSKLKLFLASLSFVYFAKAFQGSYMKSSITQIERRFDIPSSQIGFIDGSFEIGNLMVIAFVSYFGAKLHRPRLIGVGCLIMAISSFITASPHFFQGLYKYETSITHSENNNTQPILPCLPTGSHSQENEPITAENQTECEKKTGSSLWVLVFLGNMLRGIGETPVMPLGLSYMDDFAKEENTAFYIACIHTFGILGPMVGFLLGSFCAKIYVDIGAVDLDSISINHKDTRWVGAWWLGFLATGAVMLLAGIPFWFLPRSLPKQVEENANKSQDANHSEQDSFIPVENEDNKCTQLSEKADSVSMAALAKDFLPSLRRLFSNSIYILIILTSLAQVNSLIGMITFKPKYMEQIYGQSPSKVILLIGIMNIPAVALGIILGGFVMKKFQLSIIGAARISISAGFLSFIFMLSQYFLYCENAQVAGLTVSYEGFSNISSHQQSLVSQCNSKCSCSLKHWDPVCANNGLTYSTPCLAGCQSATGFGKEMVFHNCSCVAEAPLHSMNLSAVLGQCPRKDNCDYTFKIYMVVTVIGAFLSASGATPAYFVLLRSIKPDLKSLALGMQTLIVRTLGGIPPPIYFGALIDRTCLKWGTKQCGGRGACRLYNANAFRVTFLGLIYGLSALSFLLWTLLYKKISYRQRKLALQNQDKAAEQEANNMAKDTGNAPSAIVKCKEELDKETSI